MSERYRILIADAIAPAGLEPLRANGRFELIERSGLKGEALADALSDVDGVIVRSGTRITRESLVRADRLKVIGRAGVGVDNIDVEAATERGVAVLNAPMGNTISAAELAFALLLAVVRRVPAADRSMKAGAWDRKSFNGIELYGKTLGLVGAGRIGSEVGRRARAFGMQVIAFDPYLSDEQARARQIERVGLEELLRRSDVVSLHVPLTDSTAGMIGERELAMMKPGAFLVNAARGGVVDEAALHGALVEGKLAGAALDVFEQEPLPADHPLRKLDNVVLTPHLGAATEEAQQNVALEIAEAIRAALIDGDYSRAVNAPALGGEEMRRLRPVLDLSQRIGRLACALSGGSVRRVEVHYAGPAAHGLRPVTASALIGVLSDMLGRGAVNYVNAEHLALARGIDLKQVQRDPRGGYAEYVEVVVAGDEGVGRVAGAVLAEGYARVIRIGEYRVDMAPRGPIVVLRNRDVPGVIGRVGTLLGRAGINIAEYHQSRREAGGEALATISVDARLDPDVVEALRAIPEIFEVHQVQLD